MRSTVWLLTALAAAAVVLGVGTSGAAAARKHARLTARLAGMGEHGRVNLRAKGADDLCWTFDLMGVKGIRRASIRDKAGMVVAKLGRRYRAKGCTMVAKKALRLIETRPRRYRVWVDTKAHPGDLRGRLQARMMHA